MVPYTLNPFPQPLLPLPLTSESEPPGITDLIVSSFFENRVHHDTIMDVTSTSLPPQQLNPIIWKQKARIYEADL